ncbi:kinase-like domain-containing protein [Colletotrichum phormii]|uniref:Kinase-like domain-containing protein n=1 Tax=Colletotrichum phormii TaxID=359342 RepID=A0AAI9ZC55_9PEZI|nr:kinase-like domain-containing protein [Colletotrichum phormii]KAK1621822.1 kinase-like domain-containing protein [Colletotrichum phormii]
MAPEPLQQTLIDSRESDALNNVRKYVPIVDVVFSNNLKLVFVILLCLGIPWDIKKLHEAGFTDQDLPLERTKTEGGGDCLQSGLDPKKHFVPPKKWAHGYQAENFVNKQWLVMAPVFGSMGEYQKLHPLNPLPLIEAESLIHNAANVIWRAKIQSSHQTGSKMRDNSSGSTSGSVLTCRGYRAQSPCMDVAIKEFRFRKDFDQERSNLSTLRTLPSTKHIAQSLAAFSQGNRDYIISPWAEGGDLDQFWQTHGGATRTSKLALWSLDQMLGLAKALYALHAELGDAGNCRHGDRKPGNILHFMEGKEEGDVGILKITDFGISRIHLGITLVREGPTLTRATSPSYEAPEAVTSKDPRSRKYDIWSIGCIFLEFVVWLIQDWDAVESFGNARKSTWAHADGAVPSGFYRIHKDNAIVHPEVSQVIQTLRRMPQSAPNTALGKLLGIIKDNLIKIDPTDRTDAKGLCEQLEAIVSKAKSDPGYLWNSGY